MTPDFSILTISLGLAVPVAMEEVRAWTPDRRIAFARAHADVIASRSDDLLFGAKKKGETAQLFAVLARCLACLAYQPGGVTFMGQHWEAGQADG